MMNYFFKYKDLIGVVLGFALLAAPLLVMAANPIIFPNTDNPNVSPNTNNQIVSPSKSSGGYFTLQNPLKVSSICGLVQTLLKAALLIGIPIAVLFIVWAGFRFILARGSPGELASARTNFLWTIIGIGIFVGASLIAAIIVNTLEQLGVQGVSSC